MKRWLVLLCLLAGCSGGLSYDEAMKRLVAEQKSYDWIESKIAAIGKVAADKDAEYSKKIDELSKTYGHSAISDEDKNNYDKMLKSYGVLQLQNIAEKARDTKDWDLLLLRQRVIVENTNELLDRIREKEGVKLLTIKTGATPSAAR